MRTIRERQAALAGEWLCEHPDAPLEQQWCSGCGEQMHVGEPNHKVYWPGHSEYREPPPEPIDWKARAMALRDALLRMVNETYETHHTPSSESGPAEWDYTLSEPTVEAVEQALRVLTGFTTGFTDRPTETSEGNSDLSAELGVARPAGLEPTTFRSAT